MLTKETKLNSIHEEIRREISDREYQAEVAFEEMEKFNISSEEYKRLYRAFGFNCCIAGYLGIFNERSADIDESAKDIEKRLRFHAYQVKTKGALDNCPEIAQALKEVAAFLDSLINRYFEAEYHLSQVNQ